MIRIFKLLVALKSVAKIIAKSSKGLGFNTSKSLTDRLNEIKTKRACDKNHGEQGD